MKQKNVKNTLVSRIRSGSFSLTIWQSEWETYENREAERDSNFRLQERLKVCLQYGRFNHSTQRWDNQPIWFQVDELRDLRHVLEALEGMDSTSPMTVHGQVQDSAKV